MGSLSLERFSRFVVCEERDPSHPSFDGRAFIPPPARAVRPAGLSCLGTSPAPKGEAQEVWKGEEREGWRVGGWMEGEHRTRGVGLNLNAALRRRKHGRRRSLAPHAGGLCRVLRQPQQVGGPAFSRGHVGIRGWRQAAGSAHCWRAARQGSTRRSVKKVATRRRCPPPPSLTHRTSTFLPHAPRAVPCSTHGPSLCRSC